MNMNNKSKWITETAIMIALLVVLQTITRGFGQFVTGSCVNFVLAMTTLLCGLSSAITVAVVSPFFAFVLGIGPAFLPIVPGISFGNTVLVVLLWFILGKYGSDACLTRKIAALIGSAVCKFLVLYLLITKIILPTLPLNEKQIGVISASFSWPQLVTAVIGVSLGILLWPQLKQAVTRK